MSTWFITGASRGFGRLLASAAFERGDEVVATARDVAALEGLAPDAASRLLPVRLDVTDEAQAMEAVRAGVERFGRIDVAVNNAGYGLFGAVEEASDAEVRALFDTNVLGLLTVTRALLPTLRAQRSGRLLNLSSSAGFAAGAGRGLYGASKFAVEALSEALHEELAPLGVHVTAIEPGSFRTDFLSSGSRRSPERIIDDYEPTVGPLRAAVAANDGRQPGDPARAVAAMLEIAAMEAPPLRAQLGSDSVAIVEAKLEAVAAELAAHRRLALSTDF